MMEPRESVSSALSEESDLVVGTGALRSSESAESVASRLQASCKYASCGRQRLVYVMPQQNSDERVHVVTACRDSRNFREEKHVDATLKQSSASKVKRNASLSWNHYYVSVI